MDKIEELMKKYPLMFPDGYPACGFSCGDGWISILDELFTSITNIVNDSGLQGEDRPVTIAQIKEKFGGLRVYINSVHESIHQKVYAAIDMAEVKCFETCEDCGKPGKIRSGGWIKTRCDECQTAFRTLKN